MPDPDTGWNRIVPEVDGRWRQFTSALPMRTALLAVASVWMLGAVWSFQEQTQFATVKGFAFPHLLPLVIDGFAIAMAGVAWAASLDARPAVAARLATVIAVAASSASNGTWAYIRTDHDLVAVLLGVAVPVAANLAFEVLLAELRRQVQRRRGLPPPVVIPYPRLIRFVLAPLRTFGEWRSLVLELTAMEHTVAPRRSIEPEPVRTEPARSEAVPPGSAASPVSAAPSAPVVTQPRPVTVARRGKPRPAARRRDLEPAAPTNRGAGRRTVDPRVETLSQHLAATEDRGEVTGEMVGAVLKIDISPRTGRRLLGQARQLVSERAQEAGSDLELSVVGRS